MTSITTHPPFLVIRDRVDIVVVLLHIYNECETFDLPQYTYSRST